MNLDNYQGGSSWWVAVIEDRIDPLGLGRCRIRIFGHHSQETSVLPTTDLPWAYPVYPLNNSTTFSAPKLGEWVLGFFLDGKSAQTPVIIGVIPGLR
jgi:hypothetical protein